MKRVSTIFLIVLSIIFAPLAQAQVYWDGTINKSWTGTGTAADPIQIATAQQLAGFADSVNRGDDFSGRYIELAADIYLNDSTLADSLKLEWEHPIGQFLNGGSDWEYTLDTAWFRGNFDGKNHIIYNLFYGTTPESPDWDDPDNPLGGMGGPDFSGWAKALFGFVENATIKNVRLENAVLNGASSIATLALQVKGNSVIENCHATGVVMNIDPDYGGPAGGLIARLISGQVLNCSADVDAYASRGAGGLIGYVDADGVVRNCSAAGIAHCTEYNVGGLIGSNAGLIENSHASGRVSRAYYQHAYNDCGGFVGMNSGIIRNCSAKGNVHIYGQNGGGFVGWNTGHIESCYCTGDVHDETDGYGATASAFCAMNGRNTSSIYETDQPGTLINCFATGKTDIRKELNLTGYPAGRPSNGFLNSYGDRLAKIVNCSYRQVRPDTLMGIRGGVQELQESYMKSQAFVDTLNMFAALYGISTWQYNAGDYPTQTGIKASNITDYLAGGSGTEEDPFLIATKQHLENFREMVNHGEHFEGKYIRQTADIALNAPRAQWGIQMPEQWTAIGTMKFVTCYEPHYMVERSHTYHFRGTYDGGFHKIENMYIDDPVGRPAGLFGILYHNATIKNLSVTDAYVISPGTHAGVAILASEVERYANNVYISQCHTSGLVGDPENILGLGTASAIVNGIALEGDNWILNCSSSADVYAYGTPSAVTHQGGIGGTDTIGNFLFTGTLTKRGVTSYDRCMIPNQQDSWIVSQNGYFDSDKYQWNTNAQTTYNNLGRPTAYLQSEDFANLLNDYVDNWNATHAYKLDYWQPQEGDYPKVSPDYKPNLVVTFESNGGTAIATKRVSENSHILMPAKPTKDGYIFAGWYEDAAFTKVFDFDSTAVTQSMTLYAKWLEPMTYDISIYTNKFATEYHIKTKEQLIGLMHAVRGIEGVINPMSFEGKNVYLDNDIVLNDTTDWQYWGRFIYAEPWIPIGTSANPFLGTFNGQGHTIGGLYIETNRETLHDYVGLFGYAGANGVETKIQNVGLLAAVADMRENTDERVGLLVGVFRNGTISQCFAKGKMIISYKRSGDTGGLVGNMGGFYSGESGGVITDCYAQVDINIEPWDINAINRGVLGGGLVDYNNGSVNNSYVAGCNWQDGVSGGTISNVYYNKELSPKAGAKTGTALTTNEMHAKSSFAGFDFDTVWGRNDTINGGYPYLRCFYDNIIPDSPDPVKVTGIDFTEAGMTLDIIAGEQLQLHAKVLPEDALEQQIVWTQEYKDNYGYKHILSVDSNGLVTTYYDKSAMSINHFVVTAATYEGNYQKKCTVNVHKPQVQRENIKCRRIGTTEWSEPESYWIVAGWEYQMAFYVTPDSLHQPLTITNSDPEVATVSIISQDTIVPSFIYGSDTPIRCVLFTLSVHKEGKLKLDAVHPKGYTYNSTITTKYVEVTSININAPKTTISIGETLQLNALSNPVESSILPDSYSWSSSDENILQVDQTGLVTAVGLGKATITLTSSNPNFTATKEITVDHIQPSKMELLCSDDDGTIRVGDTCTLTAVFYPENTTMRDVKWSIGGRNGADSTYIKIIPMGDSCKLIGLQKTRGIPASVIAKSLGSSGISVSYDFYVENKILNTSLTFKLASISMAKGESKSLTLNKTYNSNENITFKSSNEDIVSINEESINISSREITFDIKALATGKATITAITEESGLTATCEVNVISNNFFTINFVNEDGTVLQSSQVREFEMPVYNSDTLPTKATTAEYTYTFAGWTPDLMPVTADATYTATYNETKRSYQIRFLNYDGTELQSSLIEYGTMPEYTGKTPTRPSTAQYNYNFDAWSPEVVSVTTDADYTANFTSVIRQYTVTFLDWDGTELSKQLLDYATPATAPADPNREGYTFKGWDKDFSNVQSDLTVTALYEQNAVEPPIPDEAITIRLDPKSCASWSTVYLYAWDAKQTPIAGAWPGTKINKDSDGWWSYTFDNKITNVNIIWNNGSGAQTVDITNVTASTCYKLNTQSGNKIQATVVDCQEEVTPIYFTVTFQDWNGIVLKTEQVEQGKSATAPANPTREGYTFTGWNKDFSNVQSDLTITAQYKKNITYFTVTFLDWDGTMLKTEQVEQGHGATAPADPTRKGYTFIGWDKDFSNVQSDLTVTALYEQNAVEPPIPDEAITVRLDPKSCASWSTVYLYAWDAKQTPIAGAWPGTKVSKDADGWWSYTFTTDIAMVNIIWNNGSGAQTVDIENVTTSTCYQLNATTGGSITATVVECRPLTALEDAETDSTPQPRKVMIDNKLYILMPDGTMYDTWGRKIN
ncbi:MAG: InlB B-repeat-containing protein [Paludibacteraceae bacterium]|nr:InlB B-repeat-containing protein [Paludibacteraceae bacterium]